MTKLTITPEIIDTVALAMVNDERKRDRLPGADTIDELTELGKDTYRRRAKVALRTYIATVKKRARPWRLEWRQHEGTRWFYAGSFSEEARAQEVIENARSGEYRIVNREKRCDA